MPANGRSNGAIPKPIPKRTEQSYLSQLFNPYVIGSLLMFFMLSVPRIYNQYTGATDVQAHSSQHAVQKYVCQLDQSTPLIMKPSKGVRVLVTGAAGFIGSHVANYCADVLEMDVIAVDDMSGGFEQNLNPNYTFVKGRYTVHTDDRCRMLIQ